VNANQRSNKISIVARSDAIPGVGVDGFQPSVNANQRSNKISIVARSDAILALVMTASSRQLTLIS